MRSLFNALRAVLNNKEEKHWTKLLPDIENDFNVTVNKSTGYAPWVLMFGKNKRLKAADQLLDDIPSQSEVIDAKAVQEKINKRLEKITEQAINRFNIKRVKAVPYTVGDKVVVENTQVSQGGKLKPKFHGPFEVMHCLPNERYALRRVGTRNRTTVAAHEQLRRWPEK